MCRLFGFRSTEHLSTHHTLRFAENALAKQSTKHPDGWGIGYYLDDQPHVCKRAAAAFQDFEYARISDVVSSPTVIAHVRKATVGELSEHNSHPFRFKRWLGAHNGHIEAFPQVRGLLLDELPPPLVAQILGTTDSEHLFYLFLSELADFADLDDLDLSLDLAMGAAERALYKVDAWVERFKPNVRSETNLLITNGRLMFALRRGSTLFYAAQRKTQTQTHLCPRFQKDTLAPLPIDGQIAHLLVASEPISGEQVWQETPQASILGIDRDLNWRIEPIHQRKHRVRGAKPLPDWPQITDDPTSADPHSADHDHDHDQEQEQEGLRNLVPTANASGDLYGEVALLSDIATPLGLAATRRLAAEGARLIVHGLDAPTVQSIAHQVRRLGADVYAGHLPTDTSPLVPLEVAVARGVEALSVLSIAVALVDLVDPPDNPQHNPQQQQATIQTAFDTLNTFVGVVRARLSKRVEASGVPPISVRWVLVLRTPSPSADLHATLQRYISNLCAECAPLGARINAVLASAATPPEDVAQVICFLASTTSRAIHGTVLRAEPALTAPPNTSPKPNQPA